MKHRWLVIGAASATSGSTGLNDFRGGGGDFSAPTTSPLPVALPLVFTHAFPGVAVSLGLADGNVPFSSVFIGPGEHGKRRWASSEQKTSPPPPNPSPLKAAFSPHVTPPSALDMRGNSDVRKMGPDLCSLVSWEEL